MLKLRNIKKNDGTIECDIYPEDSASCGTLSYDFIKKTVTKSSLPEGYEWCKTHIAHAKQALQKMIDENEIPEEKLVMWY